MKRELTLTNKQFAEELVAHLNNDKANASIGEKDGKFVVSYEMVNADGPSMDDKMHEMMSYMMRKMDQSMSNVYGYIDQLYSAWGNHQKGHLPPLTAGALNKMMKMCDMDSDYVAYPKELYASRNSVEFGAQELKDALTKLNEIDDKPSDAEVSKLIETIKAQKK